MKSAFGIFLYFVFALTLRAEIIVGTSLEWLADSSTSIGIYQVAESRKESDTNFQLSFRLNEKLKGEPPQAAASSYWIRAPKGEPAPGVSSGDRFLIFLKPDEKNSLHVATLINLSKPQINGMDSVAINSKFEVLTDPAKILATVRERIKSHPAAKPTKWQEYPNSRFDVEVPHNSPAFSVLWGGSTCYLVVPDDLKPVKPGK